MFRDMTGTPIADEQTWRLAREAVALGLTIKEAAERYGLPYDAARKRAERQKWPTKARIVASVAPESREVVAQSWAEQGEQHRRRVMQIVNRALEGAVLASPENWADLERAARIGDRAAGLEKQTPAITLAFPIATSTEASPFYDADTVFAATSPHLTPEPLEP